MWEDALKGGGNGFEMTVNGEPSTVFTEIREKYGMPVIMMTGDTRRETLEKIRELGIDEYLTKPLNGTVTSETVRSFLNGRQPMS